MTPDGGRNRRVIGRGEAVMRLVLSSLCDLLPDQVQYRCFAAIKRCRNRMIGRSFEDLAASWDHIESSDDASIASGVQPAGRLVVTHDVDYVQCYSFIPELLSIDRNLGVRATYNFLTSAKYDLDKATIGAVLDGGHEIGLHGANHDRALGFRSPAKIRAFIGGAKERLEAYAGKIRGFRTPALAVSMEVLKALDELGFDYDSSFTNSSLYSSFTPMCSPFRIPGTRLTELPLTVQDSMFVNDIPATDEQVLRMFEKLSEVISRMNGVLVANFHPVIVSGNVGRYEGIVGRLMGHGMRNMPAKEVAGV